jgi:hypothetical protein
MRGHLFAIALDRSPAADGCPTLDLNGIEGGAGAGSEVNADDYADCEDKQKERVDSPQRYAKAQRRGVIAPMTVETVERRIAPRTQINILCCCCHGERSTLARVRGLGARVLRSGMLQVARGSPTG